jgi:hypothetical protein
VKPIILRQLGIVETDAISRQASTVPVSRAQECGTFAEKGGMGILIIVAAALVAELMIALLAGSYLHHRSELADTAPSQAASFTREGSAPTVLASQGIPESRDLNGDNAKRGRLYRPHGPR